MILIGSSANTLRKCASAASTPRQELKRANVRPPAASINSPSSSRTSWLKPSRPGSGKCFGKYKTPWLAKSKGEPTSSICTFAGSISSLATSVSGSLPTKKPIDLAIASKEFPTVRVADVAITGVLVKRFERKTSETESGAKYRVEKVGSYQSTWLLLCLSNLPQVVEISLTAPFTRARSAIVSESTISSSTAISCIIALEASKTLRIGASSDDGISSNRPLLVKSPRISWP